MGRRGCIGSPQGMPIASTHVAAADPATAPAKAAERSGDSDECRQHNEFAICRGVPGYCAQGPTPKRRRRTCSSRAPPYLEWLRSQLQAASSKTSSSSASPTRKLPASSTATAAPRAAARLRPRSAIARRTRRRLRAQRRSCSSASPTLTTQPHSPSSPSRSPLLSQVQKSPTHFARTCHACL